LAEVIHQFFLEKEINKTDLVNFKEKIQHGLTQQFILEKENINFKINDFKKYIKRTLTGLTQQFISEKENYNKKFIDLKENIIIEKEKSENELSELAKVLQHFILENKLEKKKNDLKIVNFKETLQYQLTELTQQFISEKEINKPI